MRIAPADALPVGRTGRILALGLAAALAAALWYGLAEPLIAWHAERADRIALRAAMARRMAALAETLPVLREQAASRSATGATGALAAGAVLDGATDALAAAALQERIQGLAAEAGASLASVAALPAEEAGALRRIGLRVSVTAPWPVLVRLLQSVLDQATPRMLVGELRVQAEAAPAPRPGMQGLDASFTVLAFRAPPPTQGSSP